jgi:alpha-tubulin suppressor-like RCC1 family protein
VPTLAVSGLVAVSTAQGTSLFLKKDGTVWACGYNSSLAVGDGTNVNRYTPVQVKGKGNVGFLTDVKAIAGGHGNGHSLALKNDGTVWGWGTNQWGALGDSTKTSRFTPVQVRGLNNIGNLSNIRAIAAGGDFSLALDADSTVWAWGFNAGGELGNGTSNAMGQYTPVKVSLLTGIVAIEAGTGHSLAVKSDGTVWAWGSGSYGKLGYGGTNDATTPVKINGLTGIITVDVGQHHSLALKNDGTVWAWGFNNMGQLGDGTIENRLVPVKIDSISGIVQISASSGGTHSLALQNDGTIWAWGNNNVGQLGDGTTANRWRPVRINGICRQVIPPPAPTNVSAASVTGLTTTSARVSWTKPSNYVNGTHTTLVFVKPTNAIDTNNIPTRAVGFYTANSVAPFGTAYQHDINAKCVFKGDTNFVDITSINNTTNYKVLIYVVRDADSSYALNPVLSSGTANSGTGIESNVDEQIAIAVFPNPFSAVTTLQTNQVLKNASVSIHNAFGQQVKQINNVSGNAITLQRDELLAGLYFMQVTQNNSTSTVIKLLITDN